MGGFNERIWREEDWDFWKRLARLGIDFIFLPLKSGRYFVRPGSVSRVPHLTDAQRQAIEANWRAGRPIFADGSGKSGSALPNPLPVGEGRKGTHHAPRDGFHHAERDEYRRKIASVSPHCIMDFNSGAATATRDALRLLAEEGFECQAFCGTRLDGPEEGLI